MSLKSSHATLATLVLWACLSLSLASPKERLLPETTTTVLLPLERHNLPQDPILRDFMIQYVIHTITCNTRITIFVITNIFP